MNRAVVTAAFLLGFSVWSAAAVNLNIETYFDYKIAFNTNTDLNTYNNFMLSWGGLGVSGDITKDVKGNFLFDLTGNSPLVIGSSGLAGLWYANAAWTVFTGSVLTVGLQDSLFGLIVPSDAFCRNIDYGVTWSQNFGDIFGYSFQVIQGQLSVMKTWFDAETFFDGLDLSDQTRRIPTVQLMLTLTPLKGLTLGGAGRFSAFSFIDMNYNTDTNFEVGAEGYLTVGGDLVPGLSVSLDYVAMMNFIRITNASTNANSFYFAADMSYAIGPVSPGVRYWVKDSNLASASTNDIDQYAAVYAKISLTSDGYMKLIPYFEYRLTENGSAKPADLFVARLRFDYQFDIPLVKDGPVIK